MEQYSIVNGDYRMDVFDTYSFLIIAPASFISSGILIFAQLVNRILLRQPGDLIFMVTVAELFLSAHYFMSAIRTTYITATVTEASTFCQINSWLSNIFTLLEYLYNISILCHIIFTVRSAIQKSFVPKKIYHIAAFAITILYNYTLYRDKSFGKTPYGMCGHKIGHLDFNGRTREVFRDNWPVILATLFGVALGIFVLVFTSRSLQNFGSEMNELKRDFLNYYSSYIQACIAIWLVFLFSQIAQVIGTDQDFDLAENQTFAGSFFRIGRVGNTAKALMPLILFFIRIQDPLIRKNIWTPFSKITKKYFSISNSLNKTSLTDPLDVTLDSGNMADQVEGDPDDLMWMNLLPTKIKENYTRTFLACIQKKFPERLEQKKKVQCLTQDDTQDVICYTIKGQVLKKMLKTDKSILDCKFTIYCPALFREIIQSSWSTLDIASSMDISKNEDRIKKAGESGGGASGELFLFTHDSKLILKTATNQEIEIFKKIMLSYKDHLKAYKNSQIGKIFGLFDFRFYGSDKSIKLILMENLFLVPSRCILRKYDMKGSKHSRRVLKDYKSLDTSSVIKPVLKDLDFIDIDKDIKLTVEAKEELIRNINADVSFFTNHEIIDYSIILAVIDLKSLSEMPPINDQTSTETSARGTSLTADNVSSFDVASLIKNPHYLQSVHNPNLVYLIGIIDYFQLYNMQKAAERFFKRLMKCNPKLDTSSQPPSIYSERFLKWIKMIVSS